MTSNNRNSKWYTDLKPQAKVSGGQLLKGTHAPSGDKGRWKGLLTACNHNLDWAGSPDCTSLAVSSSSLHLRSPVFFLKGTLPDYLTHRGKQQSPSMPSYFLNTVLSSSPSVYRLSLHSVPSVI